MSVPSRAADAAHLLALDAPARHGHRAHRAAELVDRLVARRAVRGPVDGGPVRREPAAHMLAATEAGA